MPALARDRNTQKRVLTRFGKVPVDGGSHIFAGSLVGLNATGYLVPMTATTSLRCLGMALENVDNTDGADGDLLCDVEPGIFKWANGSGADEIAFDDIESVCYALNDNSVAIVGTARSVAGRVIGVESDGVWVRSPDPIGADGDLVAANNLSDVALAATARVNLEAQRHWMPFGQRADLIASNNGVYYYVHTGPSAVLIDIRTRLSAALATGNATLTFAISTDGVSFTNVTGGVVTITQSGSAIGDLDSASPSAARTIAEGNVLRMTVGGTNTGAAFADVGIEMTY